MNINLGIVVCAGKQQSTRTQFTEGCDESRVDEIVRMEGAVWEIFEFTSCNTLTRLARQKEKNKVKVQQREAVDIQRGVKYTYTCICMYISASPEGHGISRKCYGTYETPTLISTPKKQ